MTRGTLALVALVVSLLALCVVPRHASAEGGAWYVAPDGDNDNSCLSPTTPCGTIEGPTLKAAFQPGDAIRVAIGVYGVYCESDCRITVDLHKSANVSGGWNRDFTAQTGMSSIGGDQQVMSIGLVAQAGEVLSFERFIIQNRVNRETSATQQPIIIGGIYNGGTLTLRQCVVRDNIVEGQGGGIYNAGRLTIIDSAIINNSAEKAWLHANSNGGGIYNAGSLTIVNSTLAGNSANQDGGAIFNAGAATVSISSSTIVENTAVHRGSAIYNEGNPVALKNSIVGNNYRAPTDCQGPVTSGGYNLFGNPDFGSQWCGYAPGPGDQAGVTLKLGALGDYGGTTPTAPLLPGSPAINAGRPQGCADDEGRPLANDQRGAPRSGRCDAGAFEAGLWVAKSATGRMRPGDPAYFTLTVSNLAREMPLAGATLIDALPPELIFEPGSLTASAGAALATGNTISWSGTIPADQPVTINFAATLAGAPASGAVVTNTAEARWDDAVARATAKLVVASEFGTPTPTPPASCPFTPTPRPPFNGALPPVGTAQAKVQHCADDAHERLDTRETFYGLEDVTTGGNPGGPAGLTLYTGGFLFRDVRVPQYARITSATLSLFAQYQSGVPVPHIIVGDNRGNGEDFTAYSVPLGARPRTYAQAPWEMSAKAYGRLALPDIAAIAQELVNRSDWRPGNDMAILIDPAGGATRYANWRTRERGVNDVAQLTISYNGVNTQTPTPTPTVTPTVTPTATVTEQTARVFLPLMLR